MVVQEDHCRRGFFTASVKTSRGWTMLSVKLPSDSCQRKDGAWHPVKNFENFVTQVTQG